MNNTAPFLTMGHDESTIDCERKYTVGIGDTLMSIAQKCCPEDIDRVILRHHNPEAHQILNTGDFICLDACKTEYTPNSTECPHQFTERQDAAPFGMILIVIMTVLCIALVVSLTAITFLLLKRGKKKSSRSPDESLSNDFHCSSERFHIPRENLNFGPEVLGMGEFGKVYHGTLTATETDSSGSITRTTRDVAVKTLLDGTDPAYKRDFMREMKVLMNIGQQMNIVNILGVIMEGELLIVMELCALGPLNKYLQNYASNFRSECSEMDILSNAYDITGTDLLNFVYQIARGMQFVSASGIIHRDLAARNILIDDNRIAKVSDFGFARVGIDYNLRRDRVKLPLRWMAPESITAMIFNEKTDVWSFGVVVWEIFTFGAIPYQDLDAQDIRKKLCHFLNTDQRLPRPVLCSDSMCWEWFPDIRPRFAELRGLVGEMLPSESWELYEKLDSTEKQHKLQLNAAYGVHEFTSASLV